MTVDLLSKNENISMSDISLYDYMQFFENVLCTKKFIYELEDGRKIALKFEKNNFMHLIGAQHILGKRYKASKFSENVGLRRMTFEHLERRNNIVFNDLTDRFLHFSNIYYILRNAQLISFDKDVYEDTINNETEMDYKYLLFEDIGNKKVHIGIDTYNSGRHYYGKSVLVNTINNPKLTKNQEQLYIKNIVIIDLIKKVEIYNKQKEIQQEVATDGLIINVNSFK